jgi:surfactin synthase thioesterase subunit
MPESADTDTWVRRFHPAPQARTRLVCMPHAGGSASYFFPVSRVLAPEVEVLAIQYPGRQDRRHEKCIEEIPELADLVARALAPWLDRPLAFFGHSMGATLAFEVAVRLEAVGVTSSALFASGRRAPSRHREESVHLRGDDGLLAEIRTLNGTQSEVLSDDEMVRMVLPSIRGDYRAIERYRYRPGPKLACPIFALIGDTDPRVTVEEARSWSDHTADRFELRIFSGGHFYLNAHVPAVLKLISRHLDQVATTDDDAPARGSWTL